MEYKLYAILIKDEHLKDSPYFYMSAGDELQQGRCFVYKDKTYAKKAKKEIEKLIKGYNVKVFIKEIALLTDEV